MINQHICTSLQHANKVNDQLLFVHDVLPQSVIDGIQTLIHSGVFWKRLDNQPGNRKVIRWIPDSIIEELHEVGELLATPINECFGITDVKFQGLQLWKDSDTYNILQHQDNPAIDVAMQIYLFNDKQSEGTTFTVDNKKIDLPFIQNTGYVLWKKSNNERIMHGITSKVSGSDRITLYLTWSRFGKQAPDTDDPAALL